MKTIDGYQVEWSVEKQEWRVMGYGKDCRIDPIYTAGQLLGITKWLETVKLSRPLWSDGTEMKEI